MGGFSDIGNVADYLGQSGSGADTGSGFGGLFGGGQIDLTPYIGNLSGQSGSDAIGSVFGDIFGGQTGSIISSVGSLALDIAGDITLNPISIAKTLLDIGSLISSLLGGGVPRTTKTQGLIDWLNQQSDKRYHMVAWYIEANILNAGLVISSPATPGHHFEAFMGVLVRMTGPLPDSGQVINIPVKGTQKGVNVLIPDAHGPLDTLSLVHLAFGVKIPTDISPPGVGHLLTSAIMSGNLHTDFVRGLISPRGVAIANTVGKLYQSGDHSGMVLFLHNVTGITTRDITDGYLRADFQNTGHLKDFCVCGETDPTLIDNGECMAGFVNGLSDPNNPGNLNNLTGSNPSGYGLTPGTSGGSSANASGGTSTVSVNVSPDAGIEQLLAEELSLFANQSASSSGIGTGTWILIGIGAITVVLLLSRHKG